MTIAALAYTDALTEWTANNLISSSVVGPNTARIYHELELDYGGHYGQGFWIVTGDVRVANRAHFSGCDIHLWSEQYQLTYGTTIGYLYDTEWHNFSIIAGWWGDEPSTMKLMLRVYTTTGQTPDTIHLRNVRLAFVQLNDSGGLDPRPPYVQNVGGYHQTKAYWDYSEFTAVSVAAGSTNTIISLSANGLSNSSVYYSIRHINGLDCYGGAANANNQYQNISFTAPGGTWDGRTYIRSESGYYPSYGWINEMSSLTTCNLSITLSNFANSAANAEIDIYGGYFMMLTKKRTEDNYYILDQVDQQFSGTSNTVVAYQPGANTDPATRYLVLAAGTERMGTAGSSTLQTEVKFQDETLSLANTIYKGGGSYMNAKSFFAFGNVVTDDDPVVRVDYTVSSSSVVHRVGPISVLAIELDRDYTNSTAKNPATANSSSGSVQWANANNSLSTNTSHYASMTPVATAANNAYLRVSGFGFADHIPSNAEIGYVWMFPVYRRGTGTGSIIWDNVRMMVGGAAVGTSCAWSTPWTNDWNYSGPDINFGTSTFWNLDFTTGGTASRDGIWNYRPTAAQVRGAGFGFLMRCRLSSGTASRADVAYVRAVVYYKLPGETFIREATSTVALNTTVSSDKEVTKTTSVAFPLEATVRKEATATPKTTAFTLTADPVVKTGVLTSVKNMTLTAASGTKFTTAAKNIALDLTPSVVKLATRVTAAAGSIGLTAAAGVKEASKAALNHIVLYPEQNKEANKAATVALDLTASLRKVGSRTATTALDLTAAAGTKLASKARAVSLRLTPSLRKVATAARSLSVGLTATMQAATTRLYSLAATVSLGLTPSLRKQGLRSSTVSLPLTASTVSRLRTLVLHLTASLGLTAASGPKTVSKNRALALDLTASGRKTAIKTASTALDLTATLRKTAQKAAETINLDVVSVVLTKVAQRSKVVLVDLSVTGTKLASKAHSVVLTLTPSLRKTATKATAAVALDVSATLRKEAAKATTTALDLTAVAGTKLVSTARSVALHLTPVLRKVALPTAVTLALNTTVTGIKTGIRSATVAIAFTVASILERLSDVRAIRFVLEQLNVLVSTADGVFRRTTERIGTGRSEYISVLTASLVRSEDIQVALVREEPITVAIKRAEDIQVSL